MANPMMLMKLKGKWEKFCQRHPKFIAFLQTASNGQIQENGVLEITVKKPDGSQLKSNIRVTPEDVELLRELTSMLQNGK